MKYAVILLPQASANLEAAAHWIAADSPTHALAWFDAITDQIATLANFPFRCPLAPESREYPVEIRQLLYGSRRSCYRILFTIEGETVRVFYVRHAMRSSTRPEA